MFWLWCLASFITGVTVGIGLLILLLLAESRDQN